MTHMNLYKSHSRLVKRLVVVTFLGGLVWTGQRFFIPAESAVNGIVSHLSADDIETVALLNLDSTVNAPGEIQSADRTIVECEIERLSVSARNSYIVSGGSTRILKIIPEGSIVKKGDFLCQLDSREFEEMARLQRINLEQAQLMTRYTEMDLEVSNIGLEEYKFGTAKKTQEALKMQIHLAESESERASRRLEWTKRMAEKGFVTANSVRGDEFQVYKADILLSRARMALDTFQKFSNPKSEHRLNAQIQSRKWVLVYYQQWVESQKRRLQLFEDQIKKCTVIAPHDGMVVYANDDDNDTRIELGAEVRRKQDLFYLPNAKKMQVLAKLSQTIVERVQAGMPVVVRPESLDGRFCDGVVTKVAQMPVPSTTFGAPSEVKNYYCIVTINGEHEFLRPGLNAEIEIQTVDAKSSLVVSPDVIQIEGEKEFCLVLRSDGKIEKREIRSEPGDTTYVVVNKGLHEGETVVRRPRHFETEYGSVTEMVNLAPVQESFDEDSTELASIDETEPPAAPVELRGDDSEVSSVKRLETVAVDSHMSDVPAR